MPPFQVTAAGRPGIGSPGRARAGGGEQRHCQAGTSAHEGEDGFGTRPSSKM